MERFVQIMRFVKKEKKEVFEFDRKCNEILLGSFIQSLKPDLKIPF